VPRDSGSGEVSRTSVWLLDPIVLVAARTEVDHAPFGLRHGARVITILSKWLSFTRLETRTKESNIYASAGVANPRA
jgi:hypothetical protein